MTDYYKSETIKIVALYTIKWNKEDKEARKDAIDFALNLPLSGGGCGPHGCYGAERCEVEVYRDLSLVDSAIRGEGEK